MKKAAKSLLWIGILVALATPAFAETRTISWGVVSTYTDGTPIVSGTVSYLVYWSTDSGLASLNPVVGASPSATSKTFDSDLQTPRMTRGSTVYFTVKSVLDTQESALSTAYPWVVPAVTPPVVTLSSIAVSGPSAVDEGGIGMYTATATWSDATTTSVTPTWSVSPTTYASISSSGVLTTLAVTANQAATVTASYASGGVTKTATRAVTIANVTATLSSIAVSGPSTVNEGGTGTYTATATWNDTTTTSVTPIWSVSPTTYASISPSGVLTLLAVTSNQTATVTASYTSGGVTKTATRAVTIVDVPGGAPAAPKNFGISGPISSVPTELWRLHWDSVTTKSDGTPIDSVRTIRYMAYWTDDPALSAGSLRQLGSLISGTALDFDPSANQMAKNSEAYLTVRAVLDTGEQSSLAASISWRVANEGPIPPERGKIYKK